MSLYQENFSEALRLMSMVDSGRNKDIFAMDRAEDLLGIIPGGKRAFVAWKNSICSRPIDVPAIAALQKELFPTGQKAYFEEALALMISYDRNTNQGFSTVFKKIETLLEKVEGSLKAYAVWRLTYCNHPLEIEEVAELYLRLGGPDDLCEHLSSSTMTKAF